MKKMAVEEMKENRNLAITESMLNSKPGAHIAGSLMGISGNSAVNNSAP